MSWLDRVRWKIDVIADDAHLLTPHERSMLLAAAALVDQLEGIALDGDSTADDRAFYFRQATDLRRLIPCRRAAV